MTPGSSRSRRRARAGLVAVAVTMGGVALLVPLAWVGALEIQRGHLAGGVLALAIDLALAVVMAVSGPRVVRGIVAPKLSRPDRAPDGAGTAASEPEPRWSRALRIRVGERETEVEAPAYQVLLVSRVRALLESRGVSFSETSFPSPPGLRLVLDQGRTLFTVRTIDETLVRELEELDLTQAPG